MVGLMGGSGPYRARGLLSGLADVGFRQMVTFRLISVLYVAGVALVGAATLAALAVVAGMAAWLGAGWWLFAPPVLAGGVVGVLGVRVTCEWVLMAFSRGRAPQAMPDRRETPDRATNTTGNAAKGQGHAGA
ncbi:DUF4282 domain-containing protein [Actinomadura parmotrematis]|uniref:DUF4282 domain-containing protein n=1 Tax=Actinomadura parmotrematis TaxID=2864039 RepID=A0ABS7G2X8_9ACTN|nr:DUF4282 domain-containing protein [Actinomadura parmotrematis]MBW8486700.1 DUF4282 domain-containing protein [Actinomadura parmotrematis]